MIKIVREKIIAFVVVFGVETVGNTGGFDNTIFPVPVGGVGTFIPFVPGISVM